MLISGLSVGMGPVLREVPVPALFGIFLYLGVSTLSGVQMCERIKLLFMPVKYHPSVGYVRKVGTVNPCQLFVKHSSREQICQTSIM